MSHIKLFVGHNNFLVLGNGKTLSMGILAYDKKKYENYNVYSNYKLNFADGIIDTDDLDQILKEHYEAIILIDELPAFLSAYSGVDAFEDAVRNVLNQARKRRIYLWGTAQVYNEVPRHIRRKNPEIYLVYKIHYLNGSWDFCNKTLNSKCESDEHHYLVKRINGMSRVLTPHLKVEDDVKKEWFYDQYDTDEILMSERRNQD